MLVSIVHWPYQMYPTKQKFNIIFWKRKIIRILKFLEFTAFAPHFECKLIPSDINAHGPVTSRWNRSHGKTSKKCSIFSLHLPVVCGPQRHIVIFIFIRIEKWLCKWLFLALACFNFTNLALSLTVGILNLAWTMSQKPSALHSNEISENRTKCSEFSLGSMSQFLKLVMFTRCEEIVIYLNFWNCWIRWKNSGDSIKEIYFLGEYSQHRLLMT